jgi:hypothetical protein
VHFITDPVGRPPRAIAEGTVFWINDDWDGRPLAESLRPMVAARAVPDLRHLLDYNLLAMEDPRLTIPAAAAFVKFIVERWGSGKLIELYSAVNAVNSYDVFAVGFEHVYGLPLAEVETAWRDWLKVQYRS